MSHCLQFEQKSAVMTKCIVFAGSSRWIRRGRFHQKRQYQQSTSVSSKKKRNLIMLYFNSIMVLPVLQQSDAGQCDTEFVPTLLTELITEDFNVLLDIHVALSPLMYLCFNANKYCTSMDCRTLRIFIRH